MVVATGLETRFDMVEGLPEALQKQDSGVCSIYKFDLAQKTYLELQKFKGGTAVFTFPNTPIKCPGAPQKICYLADEIFRQNNVRDKTQIKFYNTLGVIFEVPKYAKALMEVVDKCGIELSMRDNLIKVDIAQKEATFQVVDSNRKPTDEFKKVKYDLLHVGPPCTPIKSLREAKDENFTDPVGWVKVDEKTMRSPNYGNIFAIGDCVSTMNKKTAAAVAHQLRILSPNLTALLQNKPLPETQYDGYASCPLVVNSKQVILAEFNYKGPIETLPLNQARPSWINYWITRYFMVWLYWKVHVRGYWQVGFGFMVHLNETLSGPQEDA
jgi:sulfide:quinone oxidoreductase